MRADRSTTGSFRAKRGISLLLFLAVVGLSPAVAQQTPADVIRQVHFDQKLDAQLPLDAAFRDERGRTVQLGTYFGKRPVIVALVYYDCPMLCNMILNGLVKSLRIVQFDAGTDFDVVVISFDARETPELATAKKEVYMQQYGRGAGPAAGWHFLTGSEQSIARVTQTAGFTFIWDEATQQFAHPSGVLVLTREGKLSRYFYGIEYAPRDLRLGLVEASAGRIGSLSDQVLLYCYHYDPTTGKYGFVIISIVRVLGTGTALALGAFMFVMFRRERRGALLKEQPTS